MGAGAVGEAVPRRGVTVEDRDVDDRADQFGKSAAVTRDGVSRVALNPPVDNAGVAADVLQRSEVTRCNVTVPGRAGSRRPIARGIQCLLASRYRALGVRG